MKNNIRFSYALDTLERGHLSDPKASHFFGDPYVPASMADKFDGDFIFLAQLRLDMLKNWDSDDLLPHEGYLYLFIDAEMYPSKDLYVFAEYTTEEPDTLLEGFNARSPIKEGLNKPYEIMPINMSGYAEDGGTRLFGLDMNYKDIGVLLQYSPRDFPEVPFLADLDGYMYILFGEEGLSDAEYLIEEDTDEGRKLMKKAEKLLLDNGMTETAEIYTDIIDGRQMQFEKHKCYQTHYITYAKTMIFNHTYTKDFRVYFVKWAADFVKTLRSYNGPKEGHPYYETTVRALCEEGLRVIGELPEKKANNLFAERKLFERTEDTEYMMGMWSENGFTEAEEDYWLNPDNH